MIQHQFLRWILIVFVSWCVAVAAAQGGPPMITDDTETVAPKHWEINIAYTLEKLGASRHSGLPLLDLNYGLSPNSQVKLEIPWLQLSQPGVGTRSGVGNMNVGVRWRFRDEDEKHRVAISMYPQVEFNSSDRSVQLGLVDRGPEFLFPIQWQTEIGRVSVGGDFGYKFLHGPSEFMYGFILGTQVSESTELMAEVHGSGPVSRLRESEIVLNFGARIQIDGTSGFMFSVGKSIRSGADPRFIGYFGMQLRY